MQEIWKDIKGFEGVYQVSSLGNVRSLPRIIDYGTHTQRHKGRILKPQPNSKGYLRVQLRWEGKHEVKFVHRLVAEAFVPNPENKPQVNHKDGNKQNNRADNLEWVDNSTNQRHGRALGLINSLKGEANHSKLTEEQVKWIIKHYKKGDREFGRKALARKFGVSHQTIKNIIDRKKWKHVQL